MNLTNLRSSIDRPSYQDEASLQALQRHKFLDMCRESAAKLGAKANWEQVMQDYPSKEEQKQFVVGVLARSFTVETRMARLPDEETLVDLIITPGEDLAVRHKQ